MPGAQGHILVRRRPKDGNDGAKGDTGIQGCILRTSEWAEGVEYRNDEALTAGTRFLDIVVVSGTDTSFHCYKCKMTHTSTQQNKPNPNGDTQWWQKFNVFVPIYTPLIMAQNAVLRFAQTNQLLVMKADNSTVAAGMGGGMYPIWAGAVNPEDAPFKVDINGKLIATGADIDGNLRAERIGFIHIDDQTLRGYDADGKERLLITPDNIPSISDLDSASALNVQSASVPGGLATATGNGCHMEYAADTEWVPAGGGAYSHQYNHASFDCSFTVATTVANTEVTFRVVGKCNIDNMVPGDPVPKWDNIVVSSSSHPSSFSGATNSSNTVTYHVRVTFSNAGTHTVRMTLNMGEVTNEPPRAYSYTMELNVSNVQEITRAKKTIIGRDGIVSIYNGNYMRFIIDGGFEVLTGAYGIKVTSSGIKKTTDGDGHWTNL